MKLSNIAKKFDNTVALDPYGDEESSFNCQLAPLELFKIDGVAVKKRSLSTAPDVVMPPRGVTIIDGEPYLIGTGTPDFWKGKVIRRNYVIQGADAIASMTSIADALANVLPTTAYAAMLFSRYLPESADSSKYPPQYQLFMAGAESAPANSLVSLFGNWYIIKESYVSTSGLRIALANVLDDPVFETIQFSEKTYVPVSDSYTMNQSLVKIMRVKWQEHFHYLTHGSRNYERGDQQVFMLKSAVPKPSDNLALSDGAWSVLSAIDEGTHWSVHVRRS
jgi:hypothetical protein